MSARFCSKLTSSSSGCEKTPQTCTVCVKKTAHLEQIRGARWGKDGFFGDLIGVLQEVPDGHDPALQPGLAAGAGAELLGLLRGTGFRCVSLGHRRGRSSRLLAVLLIQPRRRQSGARRRWARVAAAAAGGGGVEPLDDAVAARAQLVRAVPRRHGERGVHEVPHVAAAPERGQRTAEAPVGAHTDGGYGDRILDGSNKIR